MNINDQKPLDDQQAPDEEFNESENGIVSVQKNGIDAANFEMKATTSDKPYFILKAKNHQEIGRSQYYSSEAAAQNGIQSVINNAATTTIKDKTVDTTEE